MAADGHLFSAFSTPYPPLLELCCTLGTLAWSVGCSARGSRLGCESIPDLWCPHEVGVRARGSVGRERWKRPGLSPRRRVHIGVVPQAMLGRAGGQVSG